MSPTDNWTVLSLRRSSIFMDFVSAPVYLVCQVLAKLIVLRELLGGSLFWACLAKGLSACSSGVNYCSQRVGRPPFEEWPAGAGWSGPWLKVGQCTLDCAGEKLFSQETSGFSDGWLAGWVGGCNAQLRLTLRQPPHRTKICRSNCCLSVAQLLSRERSGARDPWPKN